MLVRIFLLSLALAYSNALSFKSFIKYSCDPDGYDGDCRWSRTTPTCFVPLGNNSGSTIDELFGELGSPELGCQIPRTSLLKVSKAWVSKQLGSFYTARGNPVLPRLELAKNVPAKNKCGGCGVKLRCCSRSPNFFEQALDTTPCTDENVTVACEVPLIAQNEIASYREQNPEEDISDDPCDLNQYLNTKANRQRYEEHDGHLIKTLFCSVLGKLLPVIRCQRVGNSCHCCCDKYRPTSDGRCEKDPEWQPDADCNRNRDEWATCRREDLPPQEAPAAPKELSQREKLRQRLLQFSRSN